MVADYLAGMSARQCGKKYTIDAHTVLNNLAKRGIAGRPGPKKQLVGEALRQARDLRAQGWSYYAIGREYGISHTAVRNALLMT